MALRLATGQRQLAKAATFPAPTGGIKATENLYGMDPRFAIYMYNFVPSEFGLRTRQGDSVHCEGMTEAVTSMVTFEGQDNAGSEDRMFAITHKEIWDVTSKTATPTLKFTFPTVNTNAGYGVFANFTNDAGDTFLFYADSVHGLHLYTQSTDTWTLMTGITGPTIANIRYITVHQNRVWLVEEGEADAWYLPTGAYSGSATEFYFGSQFKTGGELVAIVSWTIDNGRGMDDHLVAVSRSGDVVVYQGTNPATAATWQLVGSWSIGDIPFGRKSVSRFGGNVYILCVSGLVDLESLLSGAEVSQITEQGITAPIERVIRSRMILDRNKAGWDVMYDPAEGVVVISSPQTVFGLHLQYIMDITTKAWSIWRGVAVLSMATFGGFWYWGASDGTVRKAEGSKDGVAFDGTGGTNVEFSILSAYSDLQEPAVNKRAQYIRASFIAAAQPTYTIQAMYDYDVSAITNSAIPAVATGSLWDTDLWDTAIWGGGTEHHMQLCDTAGMGTKIAIAMKGDSSERATLLSWDMAWDSGGFL